MSDLEKNYPWHAEFLRWHTAKINELYKGQPVRAELWKKVRDWIVRDIR